MGHIVVELFGFLDFFSHGFLFNIVFLDEFVGALDLVVDHGESVVEGGLDLFFSLVDHDSSDLLIDLGIFREDIHFFENEGVLALLFEKTVSGLGELLCFLIELVVFLNFLFNFVLQSLEFKLHSCG